MLSIYMKEMKQYFRTMTGYIFLTIMTVICGFVFTTGNLLSQNGDIKIFFSSLYGIVIFLIPILTMRQFSEERKLKTQQLLFTLPLSTSDIVLGKFFSTLTVLGTGLVITVLYPVIMAFLGSSDLMVTLGNYLGVILYFISLTVLFLILTAVHLERRRQ